MQQQQQRRPPQTSAPGDGSRTLTLDPTETPEASGSGSSQPGGTEGGRDGEVGVLRLRGRALNQQKVQWEEDVVDNEFMNKKKSKICCIYHKPKEFDESSGDESDSSCGSNDSRLQSNRHAHAHAHSHDHSNNHGHSTSSAPSGGGGGTAQASNGGSTTTTLERAPTPPPPNAYERQGKGKGKA